MRIIIGSVLKFLERLNRKKRELKVDDKTEMLICCMSFKTISDANQSPPLILDPCGYCTQGQHFIQRFIKGKLHLLKANIQQEAFKNTLTHSEFHPPLIRKIFVPQVVCGKTMSIRKLFAVVSAESKI